MISTTEWMPRIEQAIPPSAALLHDFVSYVPPNLSNHCITAVPGRD